MPARFSLIVPFHRDLEKLTRCLAALAPLPDEGELIVVADAALEDCRELAARHGARLISIDGPAGPAAARNVAARAATGDVLVFIDADVMASRAGLAGLVRRLTDDPAIHAIFGSYDEQPFDPGFVSQYRNLSHAFVHRASGTRARTFWAGFGAVRRNAFTAVGGFDERFTRASVEDIDLGYRLAEAGYAIAVDPTLTACHLKRWTFFSAIVSDVRDRGIPWTQLLLRYGAKRDHLNVSAVHRWSAALVWLSCASLLLARADGRAAAAAPLFLLAMTALNRSYYGFFHRVRGPWFAARVWPLHVLHHLCNGVSLAAGTARHCYSLVLKAPAWASPKEPAGFTRD